MPDAIANLAPPPPPRSPPKAPAKPQSAPARKDFGEELERACVPDESPETASETTQVEAEPLEEQPGRPVKSAKAPKKSVNAGPNVTAVDQPQAVVDTTPETPSADSVLQPLTFDIDIDQPLEVTHTEPNEPAPPEAALAIDASITIQLPSPPPDAVAIRTTPPPNPGEAPDTSAPIGATPPLTPAPTERGQESLFGETKPEQGQEPFSASTNQLTASAVTESAASPLPDEAQQATPVEAIEDPGTQMPTATPAREAAAVKASESTRTTPPDSRFIEDNHPRIITTLRTDLSRDGGSVTIRLDPPGLGEVQVSVELRDGMMIASIQTSTEDATRLMSHSLGQLKRSLESSGLNVEKLQVQQAPRDEQGQRSGDDGPWQQQGEGRSAQQEQQRREILERVWRRLRGGRDAIDFLI